MTANIINASAFDVKEKENAESKKTPAAHYGSLDLGLSVFSHGFGIFRAGMNILGSVGRIASKNKPKSPHMIILDSMDGRRR